MFSFTKQLQVKASIRNASKLRKNLNLCLLGKAKVWYTKQLPSPFWIGLRKDHNGVEKLCKPETKFKGLPAASLNKYKMMQYIVGNVRRRLLIWVGILTRVLGLGWVLGQVGLT